MTACLDEGGGKAALARRKTVESNNVEKGREDPGGEGGGCENS